MIPVSRLNGKEYYINPDMIEFLEETPDLVVTLFTGKKVIVTGKAEALIEQIVEYRRRTGLQIPPVLYPDTGYSDQAGDTTDYSKQLR